MKAILSNLLSSLTEHNQTEIVIRDGDVHVVGDFLPFFIRLCLI